MNSSISSQIFLFFLQDDEVQISYINSFFFSDTIRFVNHLVLKHSLPQRPLSSINPKGKSSQKETLSAKAEGSLCLWRLSHICCRLLRSFYIDFWLFPSSLGPFCADCKGKGTVALPCVRPLHDQLLPARFACCLCQDLGCQTSRKR